MSGLGGLDHFEPADDDIGVGDWLVLDAVNDLTRGRDGAWASWCLLMQTLSQNRVRKPALTAYRLERRGLLKTAWVSKDRAGRTLNVHLRSKTVLLFDKSVVALTAEGSAAHLACRPELA